MALLRALVRRGSSRFVLQEVAQLYERLRKEQGTEAMLNRLEQAEQRARAALVAACRTDSRLIALVRETSEALRKSAEEAYRTCGVADDVLRNDLSIAEPVFDLIARDIVSEAVSGASLGVAGEGAPRVPGERSPALAAVQSTTQLVREIEKFASAAPSSLDSAATTEKQIKESPLEVAEHSDEESAFVVGESIVGEATDEPSEDEEPIFVIGERVGHAAPATKSPERGAVGEKRMGNLAETYQQLASEHGGIYNRLSEICAHVDLSSEEHDQVRRLHLALDQYRRDTTTHGRLYRTQIERLLQALSGARPVLQSALQPDIEELKKLDDGLREGIRKSPQEWAENGRNLQDYIAAEDSARKKGVPSTFWWLYPISTGVVGPRELSEAFHVPEDMVSLLLEVHKSASNL